MKLYMRKNAFRWGETMPLTDRSGRTRYTVTGEAYSVGKRIHVTDLAGQEAVYIRQTVPSLFPRYEIEVYGKPVAEIVKDLSFFRPRYAIASLGWELVGSLGACDYEIAVQSTIVASSHPLAEEDLLVLECFDRTAEKAALGIILTVNCIFAAQEPKHS